MRNMIVLLLLVVINVDADVYLHNPRGSNNRLNSEKRDLNKNDQKRMFDSQNNKRGGYNVGDSGRTEGKGTMTYVGGSLLNLQWTNQHECGGNNTGCDIILQYMCEDGLRDGTSTQQIADNLNADNDKSKGRHESPEYYADCKARLRDENLYHADQKLGVTDRGNHEERFSAQFTRQNNNGQRRGLECPEERDYYPYHTPTPWKDIAILTNNVDRCDLYKNQSQNVLAKGYCKFPTKAARNAAAANNNRNAKAPITPQACADMGQGMQWVTAPAHNLDAPDCIQAPVSRDNQLGNTVSEGENDDRIPKTLSYQWAVPDIDEEACTLRIRYNITVGDYKPFAVSAENDQPQSSECLPTLDIGTEYGLNPKQARDRGYVVKNDPKIEPFGSFRDLDFQLAINTAQTGRTFQDRSHRFKITKKQNLPNIPADALVHNLNVMGKRGNIVEVYPAVEYGFEPAILKVKQGDYIHPQWTGSLKNNANNDGEGRVKEDKSNIIMMTERRYKAELKPAATLGHPGNSYPMKITKRAILGVTRDTAQQLAFPQETNNEKLAVGSVNALLISAISSSVYQNRGNYYGPKLAFNGLSGANRGFFHSSRENNPWVRLQIEPLKLSSIIIINRKDCCGGRLRNIEVRAGMSTGREQNPVVGTFIGPGSTKGEHYIKFSSTVNVRFITIQQKGTNQILQINGILVNGTNANFQEIGCFRDTSQRAITGGFTRFDAAVVVQSCANKAKKAGNKIFAVQYNVECWTDAIASEANAAQTYAKYGATTGCNNGRGGGWRQNVYKIVECPAAGATICAAGSTAAGTAVETVDPCEGKTEYINCNHYNSAKAYYCRFTWLKNNCCRYCQEINEQRKDEPTIPGDVQPILQDNVPHAAEGLAIEREWSFAETVEDVESSLEKSDEKIAELIEVFDEEVLMENEKRGQGGAGAAKLDNAPAHVNLFPMQAATCQTYHYVCTRNNNFSNRSQKGKLIVEGC